MGSCTVANNDNTGNNEDYNRKSLMIKRGHNEIAAITKSIVLNWGLPLQHADRYLIACAPIPTVLTASFGSAPGLALSHKLLHTNHFVQSPGNEDKILL